MINKCLLFGTILLGFILNFGHGERVSFDIRSLDYEQIKPLWITEVDAKYGSTSTANITIYANPANITNHFFNSSNPYQEMYSNFMTEIPSFSFHVVYLPANNSTLIGKKIDDQNLVCCNSDVFEYYGDKIPSCTPSTYGSLIVKPNENNIYPATYKITVPAYDFEDMIRGMNSYINSTENSYKNINMNTHSNNLMMDFDNNNTSMYNNTSMNTIMNSNNHHQSNSQNSHNSITEAGSMMKLGTFSAILDEFPQSGTWSASIITCDPTIALLSETYTLQARGEIEFKNSHGLLPLRYYNSWIYAGILTVSCCIFLIYWLLSMAKFMQQIYHIQKAITIYFFIIIFAFVAMYSSYSLYNQQGRFDGTAKLLTVLLLSVKETCFRWLILAIASGYQITNQNIEHLRGKFQFLSSIYFGIYFIREFSFVLKESASWETMSLYSYSTVALFLIEFLFIVWSLRMLRSTIEDLRHRQLTQQHKAYQYFRYAYCATISIILGSILYLSSNQELVENIYINNSKYWWFIESGYKELPLLSLTIYISYIWRPSKTDIMFGYEYSSLQPIPQITEGIISEKKVKIGQKKVIFEAIPSHDADDQDNMGQDDDIELDINVDVDLYDDNEEDSIAP